MNRLVEWVWKSIGWYPFAQTRGGQFVGAHQIDTPYPDEVAGRLVTVVRTPTWLGPDGARWEKWGQWRPPFRVRDLFPTMVIAQHPIEFSPYVPNPESLKGDRLWPWPAPGRRAEQRPR